MYHWYLEGRCQTSYTTPCNGNVSHGAPIDEVFGSLLTIHAGISASKMHLWSSCTWVHKARETCSFSCVFSVYLHAQTAVDAGDICTWRITGKTWIPQLEPHAIKKTCVDIWCLPSIPLKMIDVPQKSVMYPFLTHFVFLKANNYFLS